MPDIRNLFPKKYLDEPALGGQPRRVVIASVVVEQIGSDPPESKPVVRFAGLTLGLVLNKTNAATIAQSLGFNTDAWVGATLELRSEMVQFRGQVKPAIRVRVLSSPPGVHVAATEAWSASAPQTQPSAAHGSAGGDGALPAASPTAAPATPEFDDELPHW